MSSAPDSALTEQTARIVLRRDDKSSMAVSLVELAIALGLLGLVAASAIATLMVLNKNASRTRMMINAKEVVQRNIESAMGAPFTSGSIPTILQETPGSNWDDDGGGDNLVTLHTNRSGVSTITGTLLRIVQKEPNALGADIRRVTFRLSYSVLGRPQSYEVTTIRAMDK